MEQSYTNIHLNNFTDNFPQKTLIMGEYYTIATEIIYNIFNVEMPVRLPGRPGFHKHIIGVRYNFYKDEMLLYRFEIISVPNARVNSNIYPTRNYRGNRKLIRVLDGNNLIVGEIEIIPNNENYFAIYDDKIDDLVIIIYRTMVAPEQWLNCAGFIVEVNGKEFGILSFYPNLIFYKNNELMDIIDEEQERRIILYTFMAYKRLKQPEIFGRLIIYLEDENMDT
jgi:hypothetical protein